MKKPVGTALIWMVAATWLIAVVAGMVSIWAYSERAGASAEARDNWPADSPLSRSTDRPTLVMTLHPMCSCSQASLAELERLMAGRNGKISVLILLSCPDGAPSDWTNTSLVRRAEAIPGVRVFEDKGDRECLRFGAKTSGQTLLFDAKGRRIFAGGITGSRGHEGDNAGLDIVADLVDGTPVRPDAISAKGAATPVFGCPLYSASDQRLP